MAQGITKNYLINRYVNPIVVPYVHLQASQAYTDAELLTICSVDGVDTCYTLKDLSGNSNHLVQPVSSSRPLWKSNAVNGQPSLIFDGTNDWLSRSLLNSSYFYTYIMAFRTITWTLNDFILHNGASYLRQISSNPLYGWHTSVISSVALNIWHVITIIGYAYGPVSSGVWYKINNGEKTLALAGSYGNWSTFTLGSGSSGVAPANIEFLECMLYKNVIDDNTIENNILYLMNKYNIT